MKRFGSIQAVLVVLALTALPTHAFAYNKVVQLNANWDSSSCSGSITKLDKSIIYSGEDVTLVFGNTSNDDLNVSFTQDGADADSLILPAARTVPQKTFTNVQQNLTLSVLPVTPSCDSPTAGSLSLDAQPVATNPTPDTTLHATPMIVPMEPGTPGTSGTPDEAMPMANDTDQRHVCTGHSDQGLRLGISFAVIAACFVVGCWLITTKTASGTPAKRAPSKARTKRKL